MPSSSNIDTHKLTDHGRIVGLMVAYAVDMPFESPDVIVQFLQRIYGTKYEEGAIEAARARFYALQAMVRSTAENRTNEITAAIQQRITSHGESLTSAVRTVTFQRPQARSRDLIEAGVTVGGKPNTIAALVGQARGHLKAIKNLPPYPFIDKIDAFDDDSAILREIVWHFWADPVWRALPERSFIAGVIRMNNGFDAKTFLDVLTPNHERLKNPYSFPKATVRAVFYDEVARCTAVGETRNCRGRFEGWSEEAKLKHMQKRADARRALWSSLKLPGEAVMPSDVALSLATASLLCSCCGRRSIDLKETNRACGNYCPGVLKVETAGVKKVAEPLPIEAYTLPLTPIARKPGNRAERLYEAAEKAHHARIEESRLAGIAEREAEARAAEEAASDDSDDSPPEDEDVILARVAARHAARLAAVAAATDERDEGPPVGD